MGYVNIYLNNGFKPIKVDEKDIDRWETIFENNEPLIADQVGGTIIIPKYERG